MDSKSQCIKNNDILDFLSKNNRNRPQIVAGFSAETKNVIKNSLQKMKNKNFIVIGASGGIGSQLVADLNDVHCNLLLGYHNEIPNIDYPIVRSAPVECQSFESIMSFIEDCKNEVDHVDGVVSLPGSILLKPPHFISEEEFHDVINLNLKSAFGVVRAAGKLLNNSSIVLLTTAVTAIGLANHEMIVAAKAGIESMVRSASTTYSSKSLRFNAVGPGLVDTPLSDRITKNPKALEISLKMHSSDRIGSPKDISAMIQFLLDPKNDWITGQTFRVDGGLSSTKTP